VQTLWMPRATSGHARTFYKDDYIFFGVGLAHCAEVAVQLIKGDVDQLRHK
jgi:hypothetical protein